MSLYQEFRKFISRGNAIDLAVGVIIGASFGKIVTSLVNDVLMPPIGVFLGGVDFSSLSFTLKSGYLNQPPVDVKYGVFLNTVIDFMIVSACIFALLKLINSLKGEDPPGTKECPECLSQIPVKAKRCSHCTIELEHHLEPFS